MSLTLLAPPSEPVSTSPSLTREQKRHIRETFAIIEPASDLVARLFYMKSVDLDPSLGVLFKSPNRVQRRKFMAAMKVAVLTTSYPREPGDPAGNFVADAIERVRARGVEVEVISPASFRHFGIAYGAGVVGNLRREPWRAALLPAMLGSFLSPIG